MNKYNNFLLLLLSVCSAAFAMDTQFEKEQESKKQAQEMVRELAVQEEYDSKERAAERQIVLRQAFECQKGKLLPTEQLYQLPSDLEEYIADFACATQKLKFLGSPVMQRLIPAVVTFESDDLFHKLTFPRLSDRTPQTHAACSHFSYYQGNGIMPIEEMPSIARTPDSFCVYYYPRATVYKICPSNFKKLHVCRMAELNYCMQLYALRAEKLQAKLVAKQATEGPAAELTLDEEKAAVSDVVLTQEQRTIHASLLPHIKRCLVINYKLEVE